MRLLIAARTSDLARIQAYQVGAVLESQYPGRLHVDYHFRQSLGDQNQHDPLWAMPEKGVFTQDFREGLRRGQWDVVVHSWKDLPTEAFPGTQVVATLPRADMRDLFLFRKQSWDEVLSTGQLKVFSSSPRRVHNLTPFFKTYFPIQLNQVLFSDVRGNIQTRLQKLLASENEHGLIVAKAAFDRLLGSQQAEFSRSRSDLSQALLCLDWMVLPLSENPTAAAQGALAIEVADGRQDLIELFKPLNCETTWRSVCIERDLLAASGGGCHQKLGMSHLFRDFGEMTFLRGQGENGQVWDQTRYSLKVAPLKKPYTPGRQWFKRESVDFHIPNTVNAHFIARSSALPESTRIPRDHIVWASGLKTWKSLASRGQWVHGCSESLGEHELRGLELLAPSLRWAKWTHVDGAPMEGGKLVPTYKLLPQEISENLDSYEEFFWMSGSQFRLGLARFPALAKARHFSGPGQTFTLIKDVLSSLPIQGPQPQALPGLGAWEQLLKESGYASQSL